MYTEDEVIELLKALPLECEFIDYKQTGYKKDKQGYFIKDVISMLNAYTAYGRNRFIIIGVDDNRELVGISEEKIRDDNEYQNWINKISPKPIVNTGQIKYGNKVFEIICINKENDGQIYELVQGINIQPIHEGQTFYRQGSQNAVLTEEVRRKIRSSYFDESKYREKLVELIDSYQGSGIPPIMVALMIGAWDFIYEGDIEFIVNTTGCSLEQFKRDIQSFHWNEKGFIKIKGDQGKFNNRNSLLEFLASKFYDSYWNGIKDNVKTVLNSIGANLSKPKDQRWCITRGEDGKYSKGFLTGIYDFIAYLATHKNDFSSCNLQKIDSLIYEWIETIFTQSDWRVWGTLESYIDSIIEWDPDVFLSLFDRNLRTNNQVFIQLFHEESTGFMPISYGDRLCQGLQKIAYLKDYFNLSMNILFQLSKIRNNVKQYIIMSLLPWKPLTQASCSARINIINTFFSDDSELAWDIVEQLLPNKIQIGHDIDGLKYCGPIETITVLKTEYLDISWQYFKLLLDYAIINENKLILLLKNFWLLFPEMQINLLKEVESRINQKEGVSFDLYLNLVKVYEEYYLCQRQNESNQYGEIIEKIKTCIDLLELKHLDYNSKLLFLKDRLFLFSKFERWEDREKAVEKVQIKILREKVAENQLFEFISSVEDKVIIGVLISRELNDVSEFTYYLTEFKKYSSDLVKGFLNGVCINYPEFISNHIFKNSFDIDFFNAIIINDSVFDVLIKAGWLNYKEQVKEVDIYQLNLKEENNKNRYIKLLMDFKLYSLALLAIYHYRYSMDINVGYLIESLEKIEKDNDERINGNIIKTLIIYCENHEMNSANLEKLAYIECQFIDLFLYDDECNLKALNNLLYYNIRLFIEIVGIVYRTDDNTDDDLSLSGKENLTLVRQCNAILNKWLELESIIDSEISFNTWFESVCYHAKNVNRLDLVLNLLGGKLFHVKSDEICGFLSKVVIDILEKPEFDILRRGYAVEAYNSRGVHWASSEGDKALYNNYYGKSLSLSELGYTYTAAIYKRLAEKFSMDNQWWNVDLS